jgi:hypothetical protein
LRIKSLEVQVNKNKDEVYNRGYYGLYADGGMLNNLPIHAFDKLSTENLFYRGTRKVVEVGSNDPSSNKLLNSDILGIRLEGEINVDISEDRVYQKDDALTTATYIKDLIQTLLYAS